MKQEKKERKKERTNEKESKPDEKKIEIIMNLTIVYDSFDGTEKMEENHELQSKIRNCLEN